MTNWIGEQEIKKEQHHIWKLVEFVTDFSHILEMEIIGSTSKVVKHSVKTKNKIKQGSLKLTQEQKPIPCQKFAGACLSQ